MGGGTRDESLRESAGEARVVREVIFVIFSNITKMKRYFKQEQRGGILTLSITAFRI